MNLAYFRKSTYSLEDTIAHVSENAAKAGWKLLGEANLPEGSGKMILICRPEWVKVVLENDYNLIGFLPCAISVFAKGKDVLVGTGQPAVMQAIAQNKDITLLAADAEQQIKDLIHQSAGVSELQAKHIKLYSTKTCPYCKMEKAWLDENNIKHELVYVDEDQEQAQHMVEKTGQMGVPVTEIQYEEGESEYIVGFDKSKLAHVLHVQ